MGSFRLCVVLGFCSSVSLGFFTPPAPTTRRFVPRHFSTATPRFSVGAVATETASSPLLDEAGEIINISGDNVDLTEALVDYATEKIAKPVSKHRQLITGVDVHLQVKRNPSIKENHVVEVTVFAKNTVIRSTHRSADMYATLDTISDMLGRKLRKYKEQRNTIGRRVEEQMDAVEEEAEEEAEEVTEFATPMAVVKRKSFPMPPLTTEEAVTCLEYIEHDFYVFRNADTQEINVVYKREAGDVGLIEPEKA